MACARYSLRSHVTLMTVDPEDPLEGHCPVSDFELKCLLTALHAARRPRLRSPVQIRAELDLYVVFLEAFPSVVLFQCKWLEYGQRCECATCAHSWCLVEPVAATTSHQYKPKLGVDVTTTQPTVTEI